MKLYIKIYKKTDFDLFLWILGLRAKKIRPTTIIRKILYDAVTGKKTDIAEEYKDVPLVSAPPELKRIDIFIEYKRGDPVEQVLLNIVDHKRNEFSKNLIRYQVGWIFSRFYLHGAKSWRKETVQTSAMSMCIKSAIGDSTENSQKEKNKRKNPHKGKDTKNKKAAILEELPVLDTEIKSDLIASQPQAKETPANNTIQKDDDIGSLFDDLMKDFNF